MIQYKSISVKSKGNVDNSDREVKAFIKFYKKVTIHCIPIISYQCSRIEEVRDNL